MKLPTLNVDVAVNTKTMQKGLADARKNLQNIGGKGAAFLGGGIGKVGALGGLGGGLGAGAIGVAGALATLIAPFKIGKAVLEAHAEAADRSRKALDDVADDYRKNVYHLIGVNEIFAKRLAEGAESAKRDTAAYKGIIDTFFAAASDEQGRLMGPAREIFVGGGESLKELAAVIGGALAGKSSQEILIEKDIATSANARAYELELRRARQERERLGVVESGLGFYYKNLYQLFD